MRIVEWNNDIHSRTNSQEYSLIKVEMDDMIEEMEPLLQTIMWEEYGKCDLFI